MTDEISKAKPQRPFRANVLKPIVHFQVSMLRMWANNIERFAGKYEKGLEESTTTIKEQSNKGEHAG